MMARKEVKKCLVENSGSNKSKLDLRTYLNQTRHTVLCLGPMSVNCVTATVQYANRIRQPIPLIASRLQIECKALGGGYVNSWCTEEFGQLISEISAGYSPLCRDHGGPWQGANEGDLTQDEAMKRAKQSFYADIASGFKVLHLDASLSGGGLGDTKTLEMLFELYSFAFETARKLGKDIEVEVGTEQQSGHTSDPVELEVFLQALDRFCAVEKLPKPLFCVVQTGTLVREMRNVGLAEGRRNEEFDQKYAVESLEKNIRYLIDIASKHGIFVKEHNADYLSDGSLAMRAGLQVGSVNIAPELGVLESKTLVSLALDCGLPGLAEELLQMFYDSHKWEKWLCVSSSASDTDKALIAGHYTFAKPRFIELKNELKSLLSSRGVSLDLYIQSRITSLIERMTWNLGYVHSRMQFSSVGKCGQFIEKSIEESTISPSRPESIESDQAVPVEPLVPEFLDPVDPSPLR